MSTTYTDLQFRELMISFINKQKPTTYEIQQCNRYGNCLKFSDIPCPEIVHSEVLNEIIENFINIAAWVIKMEINIEIYYQNMVDENYHSYKEVLLESINHAVLLRITNTKNNKFVLFTVRYNGMIEECTSNDTTIELVL